MSLEALQRETARMSWEPTRFPGVHLKQLAAGGDLDRATTALVRIAPGQRLPAADDLDQAREGAPGMEAMVLEGQWDLAQGALAAGGYSRRPAGHAGESSSQAGCTLFVKIGPFGEGDLAIVQHPSAEAPWVPGHGNLQVKPLHAFGSENTALVRWPAGERFIPHRHWGGEEIFVLSGTFEDEHGRYPAGTWIRSPHLSAHHPFVEEETVILVKTGHLPAATPAR